MQIFSEDFAVDAVCTTLPFVLKVPRLRGPRDELGDCLFCYLYDKNHASEYATLFIIPSGTGSDKSARGLAVLRYEMLPAVEQVVCGA